MMTCTCAFSTHTGHDRLCSASLYALTLRSSHPTLSHHTYACPGLNVVILASDTNAVKARSVFDMYGGDNPSGAFTTFLDTYALTHDVLIAVSLDEPSNQFSSALKTKLNAEFGATKAANIGWRN